MNSTHLVVGILAHVDAGKTTLAESILYTSGSIRKFGRVDHKDAFLDTYALERERGITIFSKQAEIALFDKTMTLLDTPGHVDFSAEMERTLRVLDYAILVISGTDGVQGHVKTLWKLLGHYHIPTFIFINKMDQPGVNKEQLLLEIRKQLDERCVDFSSENTDSFYEQLALCDEHLFEKHIDENVLDISDIQEAINDRKVYPCYFGSALKLVGVDEFLKSLHRYTSPSCYPNDFGAKVFKITRDKQGNRLTHVKITGGSLKVKTLLKEDEKADQLRIYSGEGFEMVPEIHAGRICAITGLQSTKAGEGLGRERVSEQPLLEPILTYKVQLPKECDIHGMYMKLKQLEEELPELHIIWEEGLGGISAQVMGEVQIEILKELILERFGTCVTFGAGNILYRETIECTCEGAGHFEPLRHYAEVRLLLEPTERGSGLTFATDVSEDILDRNWQRLVLTHLAEKTHRGVLTGSEITDMKITLVNGRAHTKHTEGGDFRQATYRAVRQGLRSAKSLLLEPVYEFQLEVPSEHIGRAMSDIQRMKGDFSMPESDGEMSILIGTAPVVNMRDYPMEVVSYTKGQGRIFCMLKGYQPCHNTEEVVERFSYDPDGDTENPTGSVFCDHGAGFTVPWNKVEAYMHTESSIAKRSRITVETVAHNRSGVIDEDELKMIFERTYGANKRENKSYAKTVYGEYSKPKKQSQQEKKPEVLLVDGYNIIFSWNDLKELANVNIHGARGKLADILCNYQGYRKNIVILVFDGYKVSGNPGEVLKYHNIYIVYTKEAETADQYIEKTVHDISNRYDIKVATSDALEQMIILGQGAQRMSAKDLWEDIQCVQSEIQEEHLSKGQNLKPYLFDNLTEDMAQYMDDVRMGRRSFEEEKKIKEGDYL